MFKSLNKKSWIVLSLVVVLVLSMVACAKPTPTPTPAPIETPKVHKWRMQSIDPPTGIVNLESHPQLLDRIEKASGGRIQIEIFTAGALAGSREVADSLAAGMFEMAYTACSYTTGTIPVANIGSTALPPLLWRSPEEQTDLFVNRGLEDILRRGFAEHNIYYWTGVISDYHGMWSKYPIYGIDDLKGFKVRYFGYIAKTLEKLGAAPVFLPHGEVYTALATGAIDGSGTAGTYYKTLNYYEVCPYYIFPPLMSPNRMDLMINLDAWNDLPENLQNVLMAAGRENMYHNFLCFMSGRWDMLVTFDQMGTTVITWSDEDVSKVAETAASFLPEVAALDPLCAEGVEIIEEFMREMGYME